VTPPQRMTLLMVSIESHSFQRMAW
jgi:hypothetical protein